MSPYLKDSPKEIYSLTNDESTLTFKIKTYRLAGTLMLKEGYNENGVTLTEIGVPEVNSTTGVITKTYQLQLPKQHSSIAINQFVKNEGKDKIGKIQFFDIPLVAKNESGISKEFIVHHGRFKMPLEYLVEKPLNKEGNDFSSTPNKLTDIGYFRHIDQAVPRFGKQFIIKGKSYHMPQDAYELTSLLPAGIGKYGDEAICGGNATSIKNQFEIISFPCWYTFSSSTKSIKIQIYSDFKTDKTMGVTYALRFKNETIRGFNNLLVTAYRYESKGDFKEITSEEKVCTSYFKITCRYLGPNWKGDIEDIAKEEFWNKDKSKDIHRTIYALGLKDNHRRRGVPTLIDVNKEINLISIVSEDYVNPYPGIAPKKDLYIHCANLSKKSWMSNQMYAGNLPGNQLEESDTFPIWLFSDK